MNIQTAIALVIGSTAIVYGLTGSTQWTILAAGISCIATVLIGSLISRK